MKQWAETHYKGERSCRFGCSFSVGSSLLVSPFTFIMYCLKNIEYSCFKLYLKVYFFCVYGVSKNMFDKYTIKLSHTMQLFSVPCAEDYSWGPGANQCCPPHPSLQAVRSSWTESNSDWALEMKPAVISVTAGHQGNHSLWVVEWRTAKEMRKQYVPRQTD